jgi:murein DD-endopeptidase MepM/ murein hydrolase activator NlpD
MLLLPLGLAALVVLMLAFLAGRWVEERSLPGHTAALSARIDSLEAENAKVALLARRLAEVEAAYGRIRNVMSGEVEPSARNVLLPPEGAEAGAGASVEPRARAGKSRPSEWPLVEPGFVTRAFDDTTSVAEGGHPGLDIAVPTGSYVRAAGDGVVTETGEEPQYGRFVRLGHGGDLTSLYAHNSWVFVAVGDTVEAGEVIALSGNTGRSTAPHLHLEIERGGVPVDPLPWIAASR